MTGPKPLTRGECLAVYACLTSHPAPGAPKLAARMLEQRDLAPVPDATPADDNERPLP